MSELVGHHIRSTLVDSRGLDEFMREPVVLERGDGVHVTDVNGRTYLDGVSGTFVVSLGHGNSTIAKAVAEQADKLAFSSSILTSNTPALELISALTEVTEERMTGAKLCTLGSEAVEFALKMTRDFHSARGSHRRYKTIVLRGAYHGATMAALSLTGYPQLRMPYEQLPSGAVRVEPPIGNEDEDARVERGLDDVQATLRGEGTESVGAILVEPVMTSAGVHALPTAYLKGLRRICDDAEILLIFDEIVTGFGRTGEWFAATRAGVWPDMMCVGKGISSGYGPLAACLYSDRILETLEQADAGCLPVGHTFGANPLSAAAGVETLRLMAVPGFMERARSHGSLLAQRLEALVAVCPGIECTRSVGQLHAVVCADAAIGGVALSRAVQLEARSRGLLVRAAEGPQFLTLAPPLTINESESEALVAILKESFDACQARLIEYQPEVNVAKE